MLKVYRPIESGEFIVVGGDPAAGGSDYSAMQFVSTTKLDVPIVYHSPKLATEMTNEIFPILEKIQQITGINPTIAYERQNGGVFEMDRLSSLNRLNKFTIFKMPRYGDVHHQSEVKLGWDTNTATRPKMLADLKEAVDKQLIKIYDRPTIEEMFSFVIVKTTMSEKAMAESGSHDDLVMSLAIAWQIYQMAPKPNPIQHEQARDIFYQRANEDF